MKKIAIIGAGPAGFFAAHKLKGHAQIDIFDKGRKINQRNCPKDKAKKCIDCHPCNVHQGIGGAGLMSDGKLLYDIRIGNNLGELISEEENQTVVSQVQKIFEDYGIQTANTNEKEIVDLKTKALQNGIDFIYATQAHIGSDRLPNLMRQMQIDLEEKVNFYSNKEISNLNELKDYDAILVAPGRGGSSWLEKVLRTQEIKVGYRPVDIGVRVEVPHEITKQITDVTRDMKFYVRAPTFNDLVRTFCTCPQGYVGQETHEDFVLVNGEARAEEFSPNTNFAVLTTIPLEESNTNHYSETMAKLGYALRDGKKITIQRLGDLKRGRRSKASNQSKFHLNPTFKEAEWGDISLALAARHYTNIIEGLEMFNRIIPGLTNDSTLLYAPEMKFHGLKIPTDNYLHAGQNIYVAGDGAGVSRGIVGAAASGILAAEGILKNL